MSQIDSNKPIIGLSDMRPEVVTLKGHFRVIRGYTYNLATDENYVWLMDPGSASYITMSYEAYCDSTTEMWYAAIYGIN